MFLHLINKAKHHSVGNFVGFLGFVLRRYQQDQCLQTAGSLTFTTLLALVPFLTIMLMIFSAFPVFNDLTNQFKVMLLTNLVPSFAGKIITVYMRQFSENATRLTAVGVVSLGVTAWLLILTIERAFNEIWRVKEPRPLFRRVVLYWAAMTLGPFLVGGSVSLTSWILAESADYAQHVPFLGMALLDSGPWILSVLAFSLLYYAVPNCHVPWRHAVIGGAVGAVLFELAKKGFALYIKAFGSYKLVYGAFASIPIFLLWVYVVWSTILFGAVLTATLSYWLQGAWRRKAVVGRDFFTAIRLLSVLADAQQRGDVLDVVQLQKLIHCGLDQLTALLQTLHVARLVERNMDNQWLLRKAPEQLSLLELYHLLVMRPLRPEKMHPQERVLAEHLAPSLLKIDALLDMTLASVMCLQRSPPDGGAASVVQYVENR
jgi:membrane protein